MTSDPIPTLIAAYGLTPPVSTFALTGGVNNRTVGIRSAGGDFIWKHYQTHAQAEAIRYEHRLLAWLDGLGLSFAVPAPLQTQDGDTLVAGEGGWSALFALIPGAVPDHNQIRHMEAVGAALGELHTALAAYPLERRPHFFGYGDLLHVHPRLPDPLALTPSELGLPTTPELADLLACWRDDLAELLAFTGRDYSTLPRQMTHGDYVPANTLIHEDRLAAVLDFDIAQPDARAIDIAQGLEFTLRPLERADPLPFGAAFGRGYRRWVRPSPAELAAIPTLIRLRDAVSAIWWLGRGLASGDVTPGLSRMRAQLAMKGWLAQNQEALLALMD